MSCTGSTFFYCQKTRLYALRFLFEFIRKPKLGPWARSELKVSANNMFCLFIFFGAKENERRVVYATPLQKGTRAIWSFGLRCAPQSCRDFKNSRSLCSNECSDSLKSFFGTFCGAHQMPMGKDIKHGP